MSLARPLAPDPYAKLPPVDRFVLTSTDLTDGRPMPVRHVLTDAAAGAENLSPHLAWSGFPAGTQGFAVTCFDPDAPTPSGFWHWAVADLPAEVRELPTGAGGAGALLPGKAFQLRNDRGDREYRGAAPPEGDHAHRYYFVVHAVDVPSLGLDAQVTPAVLSFNLAFHTLARAQLVATYQR